MGVDYRAIIAYGKLFDYADEVEEFIKDNLPLTEEELKTIEEDGIDEWLSDNNFVDGCCLNLCTGKGYYVGYDLMCGSPSDFQQSFYTAVNCWNKYFPDLEPQIIKAVMVY